MSRSSEASCFKCQKLNTDVLDTNSFALFFLKFSLNHKNNFTESAPRLIQSSSWDVHSCVYMSPLHIISFKVMKSKRYGCDLRLGIIIILGQEQTPHYMLLFHGV